MTSPQDPLGGQYQPAPPLPPHPEGAATSPGSRPKEVDISFWLWVASFVIGLFGLVYFVGEFDTIRDTALEEARKAALRGGRPIDEQQIGAIINASLIVGVVIGVVLCAVQLLFAFLMRKGRNWARIVLAVIGGLSILSGFFSLTDVSGELPLNLLGLLIVAGAVGTMFLPGANPWFRRRPSF